MKNKKTNIYSLPFGVGIGGLMSIVSTILGALIIAWIIEKEWITDSSVNLWFVALILIASFVGAGTATGIIKNKRMIVCLLSGLVYLLLLLACNSLFFGGQYNGIMETMLVVFAGCTSMGLLGLKKDKKHRTAKHKLRNS